MNYHAIGASLMNRVRSGVAGHTVTYQRDNMISGPIEVGSPPIGHNLLTQTGIELSEHDRIFIIAFKDLSQFGHPKRSDVIVDQVDGSKWTVRPPREVTECWRWHGQSRESCLIFTRRDNQPCPISKL